MEPLCLLNNAEKYSGEYVALRSFTDREVINRGCNPVDVLGEARKLGVDEPVVFFVPEKDVIQIY